MLPMSLVKNTVQYESLIKCGQGEPDLSSLSIYSGDEGAKYHKSPALAGLGIFFLIKNNIYFLTKEMYPVDCRA